MYSCLKFWNVQSQYNWIFPTQRISTGIRRRIPRGRITPPARSLQSTHRKPPASAKDLTLARKTICGQLSIAWAKSSLCSTTRPSHPARIDRIRTKAPRRTRTRPSLPSFLRNIGPGSSGTLPTLGPLRLVLHHHPGETSWRPSNLPTRKWRAPRKYTGSRRTILPPWSGRAGAPGEDQSRPTLPPPRRLEGAPPSCNNNRNGTTIGKKPNKFPKIRPIFTRILHPNFVFNLSIYHFIITSVIPHPKTFSLFFPEGPAVTRHSRTEERMKGRKEDKILWPESVY